MSTKHLITSNIEMGGKGAGKSPMHEMGTRSKHWRDDVKDAHMSLSYTCWSKRSNTIGPHSQVSRLFLPSMDPRQG